MYATFPRLTERSRSLRDAIFQILSRDRLVPRGSLWSIGHEVPTSDKIASAKDRWKPRAQGKRKDAHEIGDHELIDCNIKRVRVSPERLEGGTEIRHSTDFQWGDFDAERASGSLGLAHLQHSSGPLNT